MNRIDFVHSTVLGVLLTVAVAPSVALAAGAEEFLNAPVWYLEYEVSLTSNRQGTYDGMWGPMSFTSSLERVFSASEKLNLRSQGPGPLSMQSMSQGYASGSTPSVAEAQALSSKMMAQMDHTANWMVGGAAMDEGATDADIAAGYTPSSPLRVDYTRVETGKDLVDELGGKFDLKSTTTYKGTGKVLAGGFGVIIFEMDTSANSYTLVLPYAFNSQSAGTKLETVEIRQEKGKAAEEKRSTNDVPFDLFPRDLATDESAQGTPQGGVLIQGKLEPSSGKISGERTYQAHFTESNETAPGTLVFKYTLTMAPPKK